MAGVGVTDVGVAGRRGAAGVVVLAGGPGGGDPLVADHEQAGGEQQRLLPCSGEGTVRYDPAPTSSTARPDVVGVTLINIAV